MTTLELDRVQAVVLDIGNVVIAIDFAEAMNLWAERSGVSADVLAARFSMDDNYRAHERGEITAPQFYRELCRRLDVELSWSDFVDGWLALLLDPMPGIIDLLEAVARRWPVAYFTNTNELHRLAFGKTYHDVMTPFSAGFASSQLGARKPEPEAFALVAAGLGVEPSSIAFFDDTESNVDSARAAQWQAIVATSPAAVASSLGLDLG